MDPAAILVLGARVLPGGRPGLALARRIEAATTASRAWPSARVIPCGGRAWDGFVEADVIARALEDGGVDKSRIVRDRMSLTTFENLREGSAIARRIGAEQLALVTCDWHLPRALAIAHAMQLRAFGVPAGFDRMPMRRRLVRAISELVMERIDVRLARRRR